MIKGINGDIEKLLKKFGYKTYASLSKASLADLKKVVKKAGALPYKCDPSTWAKQANLAKQGKWSDLVKMQKRVKLVLA